MSLLRIIVQNRLAYKEFSPVFPLAQDSRRSCGGRPRKQCTGACVCWCGWCWSTAGPLSPSMAESASEELAPKLEPVAPKLEIVENLFKHRCAHCKSVEFHTRFRIVHLSTIRSCSLQVYQTLPPVPRTDAVFGIACHRCWRRGHSKIGRAHV